jgi:REP element-mobilizing transposase RayT
MTHPLRIDFPEAVYHATSRGNRREAIFEDDVDATLFLKVLGEALTRFKANVLAYCLMTNHYHFVIVTPQGGLSLLMRQINGVCSWVITQGLQPTPRRDGAFAARPLQGDLGRPRCLFDGAVSLRGAEPGAGGHGEGSGRLELVQLHGACRPGQRPGLAGGGALACVCVGARVAQRELHRRI